MGQEIRFISFSFISFMLWLFGGVAFFVMSMLVLRFIAKLKWLTSICLSVFAATIILIVVLPTLASTYAKIGSIFILPAVVCGIIMIIQFFRWVISVDDTIVNADERNRILKMVEEGKINTEEGTELLDAIGRSSALRGEEKFSRADMVMLMGAALVVLGFFLPWEYIQRHVYRSGLDVDSVGWGILIIGIASVIPIFVTPKNFLYKISMLQIFLNLIGIALVVSILVRVRVGGKLGPGLIFCLAGFIVETVAAVAKFKKLAA